MAVLIPDMDFPKRCGDCSFCVSFTDKITDELYYNCVHLFANISDTESKRSDCPLVEVEESRVEEKEDGLTD